MRETYKQRRKYADQVKTNQVIGFHPISRHGETPYYDMGTF